MAEKKIIVIKRITEEGHGHHGGAWKVAFADFMTAMMAFFLVMWLLGNASEETKEGIADYFSTPSVVEYKFSQYANQFSLEKLFQDFINAPVAALSELMGSKPLVRSPSDFDDFETLKQALAERSNGLISLSVDDLGNYVLEVRSAALFEPGSADVTAQFSVLMSSLGQVLKLSPAGQSDITMTSERTELTEGTDILALELSQRRLESSLKALQPFLSKGASPLKVHVGVAEEGEPGLLRLQIPGPAKDSKSKRQPNSVPQNKSRRAEAPVSDQTPAEYEDFVNKMTEE